jgi:serine/threonine-protein kinase
VLFELLTGVTAFDEPSLLELSAAILEREPVPLQTLRPDASEELEAVLLRCLEKDPDKRYQNVAELAAALYPFAPRRARISVERCYHVLKNAGHVTTEFELASVYPPSGSTTATMPAVSAARTTTPAVVDLTIGQDSVPPFAPKRRRMVAAFAALGAISAVALLLLLRSTAPDAAPAAAAPSKGTPLAAAPSAKPARVIDLDDNGEPSPPSAAPKASAPGSAASRSKPAKAVRPVPPPRAPSANGQKRSGVDELDPGF